MNLTNLRITNKKSQAEVARELNINRVTYNNYETKKAIPPLDTLIKIADYYNVTLDYLVARPFSNEFGYLSDDERELVKNYREMTSANKQKYLAEAKGILLAQDKITH